MLHNINTWKLIGPASAWPAHKQHRRAARDALLRALSGICLSLLLATLTACSVEDPQDPVLPPADDAGQQQPEPAEPDPSEPEPPAPEVPQEPNNSNASFSLGDSGEIHALVEGGDALHIPLMLERSAGYKRRVNLSVEQTDPISGERFSLSFADSSLSPSESTSSLKVKLGLGVAPMLAQRRTLTITADDGQLSADLEVSIDVQPVQAPDVYLLVGQSNMEGYSEQNAKDARPGGADETHARILQLNVTANDQQNFGISSDFTNVEKNVAYPRYVLAQDPLHESFNPTTNGKTGRRIGLGLSFAKAALANTSQDIILVPAAWAGTGFCDNSLGELAWNPAPVSNSSLGGTGLYDRALTRINLVLKETGGILRGILWHQGEADATSMQCATVYEQNLKTLISAFRQDIRKDARGSAARGANASLPFVLGTMSRGDDSRGEFSIYDEPKTRVDLAHRSIEHELAYTGLSIHDDLIPPAYDCGEGFCIHFGADAYREMGRRYYQRLLDTIEVQAPLQ